MYRLIFEGGVVVRAIGGFTSIESSPISQGVGVSDDANATATQAPNGRMVIDLEMTRLDPQTDEVVEMPSSSPKPISPRSTRPDIDRSQRCNARGDGRAPWSPCTPRRV